VVSGRTSVGAVMRAKEAVSWASLNPQELGEHCKVDLVNKVSKKTGGNGGRHHDCWGGTPVLLIRPC